MQRTATIIGLTLGGVLLFVAGFAAGWQVERAGQPAETFSGSALSKQVPGTPTAAVPRGEAPAPRIESAPVSRRTLEHLALLMELNRRLRAKFSLSPVDFDQKLNEDFVRLFDVTPAERTELESAAAAADAELAQMTLSIARIESRAEDGFTISIPAFPQEGDGIYDRFVAKIAETMGPERTSYMREMEMFSDDRLPWFEGFGIAPVIVEINPSVTSYTFSVSSQSDEKTGLSTNIFRLSSAALQKKYPLIYEKMRAAGQLPDQSTP